MAITHLDTGRKISGGRKVRAYKKKLRELGSLPTLTTLGEKRLKEERTTGGHKKLRLLTIPTANVYSPKDKKFYKLKIETIVENKSNINYIRRNIITKGAIIKTEKGNAKVTSRPGQEGSVNAVLI